MALRPSSSPAPSVNHLAASPQSVLLPALALLPADPRVSLKFRDQAVWRLHTCCCAQ